MNKKDILFAAFLFSVFAPFIFFADVLHFYEDFNKAHGMITAFVKFAILATIGESIGLRIRKGVYNEKGFGILPRATVWGVLGVSIAMAFIIFSKGVPPLIEYMGVEGAASSMQGPVNGVRVLVAFSISALMNVFFAPVFMAVHKITDSHIIANGGTLRGLFRPIPFAKILQTMDWGTMWRFVYMKTIPFFWIPMHTITFCLPKEYRVLIAAALGIVLGVLLALASLKSSDQTEASKSEK